MNFKRLSRSMQWLRSFCAPMKPSSSLTEIPPRAKRYFRKLFLEELEGRICLSQTVDLGPLTFEVNDNFTVGGTVYSYSTSPNNPVLIGASGPGVFTPVAQLTQGNLSFDTSMATNPDQNFTVNAAELQPYQANSSPNIALAPTGNYTIKAADFADGNFNSNSPSYSVNAGPFNLTITTFGLGSYTGPDNQSHTALEIQGSIALTLVAGTSLTFAINGPNALYIDANATGGSAYFLSGGSFMFMTSFTLSGVTVAGDLGIELSTASGQGVQTVVVWGSASIMTSMSMDSNYDLNFSGNLGASAANPGLVFNANALESLNIAVTGGIGANMNDPTLGGLGIELNGVTLSYVAASDMFAFSGMIGVKLAGATFSASLGTEDSPGLTVTNGVVSFTSFKLTLSDLSLGILTINSASLSYSSSNGSYTLAGSAMVTLEQANQIMASFALTYDPSSGWSLQEIGLTLTDFKGAPLVDGISLVSISGELSNIGSPSWSITGSVTLAFGEEVPVGPNGQDGYIVLATGSVTVNRNELIIQASAGFGVVLDTMSGAQTDYLGSATGTVTLNWGLQLYELQLSASFYSNTFSFNGLIKYYQGDLFVLATAAINVPSVVPLIGGDQIATAGFAFNFEQNSPSQSYFAAWVGILGGEVGFEYDLTGDFSIIGKSAITGIENMTPPGPPGTSGLPTATYAYSETFNVQAGTNTDGSNVQFIGRWYDSGSSTYIELMTPDGSTVVSYNGGITPITSTNSQETFSGQVQQPPLPQGQIQGGIDESISSGALPPGIYTLTIFSVDPLDPANIIWTALADFNQPSYGGFAPSVPTAGQSIASYVSVDPALVALTTVNLYADTSNSGYQGVMIASLVYSGPVVGQTGVYNFSMSFPNLLNSFSPGTYYFYSVANDSLHPAIESPYSGPFTVPYANEITGTILDSGDNRNIGIGGLTVFLDLNNNGILDPGEPSGITSPVTNPETSLGSANAGQYAFAPVDGNGNSLITAGQTYSVVVITPPVGYQGATTQTFTAGSGLNTVNFTLQQTYTIAGTVFSDLNQNGVQDNGELGVSGVTVYLDLNNNGMLDMGTDSNGDVVPLEPTATTDRYGDYQFLGQIPTQPYTVRYVLPAGYLVSGGGASFVSVPASNDPFGQAFANLATLPGLSINGSITQTQLTFTGQTPEPQPQAGVTVQVSQNGSVVASTTTDANGNYLFTTLAAGSYQVSETPPANYVQVSPFSISPNLNVSNAAVGAISAVASADFNNDGQLDYAAFLANQGQVEWFPGNGNGTFGAAQLVTSGLPTSSKHMEVGDFNGDGYPDLLILGTDSNVYLVLGTATGLSTSATMIFASSQVIGLASPDGFINSFTLDGIAVGGDFDGDKRDDFVVYGVENTIYHSPQGPTLYVSQYVVFILLSSNNFAVKSTANIVYDSASLANFTLQPLPNPGDHALAIGDLNNDGAPDLFLNFWQSGKTGQTSFLGYADAVAYGHSTALYGTSLNGTFGDLSNGFYNADLNFAVPGNGGPVALADLTGNGILDAVGLDYNPANGLSANIYVLQQTAVGEWVDLNGNFSSANDPALSVNGTFGGRTFVTPQILLTDVNGDGTPDIVVAEEPTDGLVGQIIVYFNQYNLQSSTTNLQALNSPTNFLAQFNTNAGNYQFYALSEDVQPNGAMPNSIAAGDFNDDGQTDLILGDAVYRGTGGVWMLMNTSQQVLTGPTVQGNFGQLQTVNFGNLQVNNVSGGAYTPGASGNARTGGSVGIAGAKVFLDLNGNGILDPGEPFAVTNSKGRYTISGPNVGTSGVLRIILPSGSQFITSNNAPILIGSVGITQDFIVHTHLLAPVKPLTVALGEPLFGSVSFTKQQIINLRGRQDTFRYSLLNAPAGMTIDPISGVIHWLAAVTGQFQVMVLVRNYLNPNQTDTMTFTVNVVGASFFAVGAGAGSPPVVDVYSTTNGGLVATFYAFDPQFKGGVSVAVGDFNHDGTTDIVVGAGINGGPEVIVVDGTKVNQVQANGQIATSALLGSFYAYDPNFLGGVHIAVGDVNGDGTPDIVTGAGPGGGPHVKVIDGTKLNDVLPTGQIANSALLASFMAYDVTFRGGVFVAVGHLLSGPGLEVITGAGPGGGPHVRSFMISQGNATQLTGPAGSFYAYEPSFMGGVSVAAADYNGDGVDEIVTGAGPGGGPHVKVFDAATLNMLQSFFAYDPAFRGGVAVGAGTLAGDTAPAILTGAGAGGGPHVIWLNFANLTYLDSFYFSTQGLPGGNSGLINSGVSVGATGDSDLATEGVRKLLQGIGLDGLSLNDLDNFFSLLPG